MNKDIDKNIERIKNEIRNSAEFTYRTPNNAGGQSCGVMQTTEIIHIPELDLTIELGYHRSRYKNRELIKLLADMVIDELIK